MTFHFDETETAATAGENIPGQLIFEDATEFGKKFGEFLFGDIGRQIARVKSKHGSPP
jgi:hypothetical protein